MEFILKQGQIGLKQDLLIYISKHRLKANFDWEFSSEIIDKRVPKYGSVYEFENYFFITGDKQKDKETPILGIMVYK